MIELKAAFGIATKQDLEIKAKKEGADDSKKKKKAKEGVVEVVGI